MSRDRRGNRTQEVDGSSPISSTTRFNNLRDVCARKQKCECLVPRLVQPIRLTIFQQLTRNLSPRIQEVVGSISPVRFEWFAHDRRRPEAAIRRRGQRHAPALRRHGGAPRKANRRGRTRCGPSRSKARSNWPLILATRCAVGSLTRRHSGRHHVIRSTSARCRIAVCGSLASVMLRMAAIESTPVAATLAAFDGSMPPIATSG